MLEVYAAWTEGAVESDIEAIERAMGLSGATIQCERFALRCLRSGTRPPVTSDLPGRFSVFGTGLGTRDEVRDGAASWSEYAASDLMRAGAATGILAKTRPWVGSSKAPNT